MLLKIAFVYFYAAALMVLATALPTARQSTHEYDTYQDKLSALLNEYESRRGESDDTAHMHYEEAMQLASQRYEQDRIREYNKTVYERALLQHITKQKQFEERLAAMRVQKMAESDSENERRKQTHRKGLLLGLL